jgi:hypothetical protein
MAEAMREQGGGPEQAVPPRCSWADGAFVVLLTALVWAAYWPSLQHAPRADQWPYLLETIRRHDFADLVRHTYSYNRTRGYGQGDAQLFRPLLFVTLAAEKALFGTNLWMPQAVGILLHCVVTSLLLALLRRVAALAPARDGGSVGRPRFRVAGLLPYAAVAFFALNPAVIELVVFTHLHGYLLFLVLLLGSLVLLLGGTAAPPGRGGLAFWGAWVLACLSAFAYEMGQFAAVLAGLFVAAAHYRRVGARHALALFAAFASILPLYQAVDQLDRLANSGEFTDAEDRQEMLGQALTPDTLRNAGRFTAYTAFQPFVPSADKDAYVRERLDVPEWAWNGDGPGAGPALVGCLALVPALALGLAGLWRLARGGPAPLVKVFLLLVGLYAVYAGMNVIGRMNVRPEPDTLSRNSYYTYPALLLALAAGFTAWQGVGRTGRAGAVCRGGLVLGLTALSAVGGLQVWRVNGMLSAELRPIRMTTGALNHFIARHRGEPDFSLRFAYGRSDAQVRIDCFPVTTILFNRWMTAREPKYLLALRDGRVVVCRPAGPAASATSESRARTESSRRRPSGRRAACARRRGGRARRRGSPPRAAAAGRRGRTAAAPS